MEQHTAVATPVRVKRTYTQRYAAPVERLFPLLCPVREAEWIEGWAPTLILSESGVAEADCVFVTSASPVDAVWVVTRHEPDNGFVEMIKVTPEVTVCRLSIRLRAVGSGCEADVCYAHTSLGPRGDAFVDAFTDDAWRRFMRDWELRLAHYLECGEALSDRELATRREGA